VIWMPGGAGPQPKTTTELHIRRGGGCSLLLTSSISRLEDPVAVGPPSRSFVSFVFRSPGNSGASVLQPDPYSDLPCCWSCQDWICPCQI
jgi:hypothetical protein